MKKMAAPFSFALPFPSLMLYLSISYVLVINTTFRNKKEIFDWPGIVSADADQYRHFLRSTLKILDSISTRFFRACVTSYKRS